MLNRLYFYRPLIVAAFAAAVTPSSYAQDIKVVRYSKTQLEADAEHTFYQPRNLGSIIVSSLREVAVTLTERQSGKNSALRDLAASAQQPSDLSWARKMAALTYDPATDRSRLNEWSMQKTFLLQGRKAAEVNFKRNFPIWQKFKNGLTFNLDLGRHSSMQQSAAEKQIRYGLVERDILPAEHAIDLAVFSNSHEIDRAYATQAKVIYSIDRLDADSSRADLQKPNMTEISDVDSSAWAKLPQSNMSIKIDAANNDESFGDQIAGGSFPGARVTIKQFDGLVSTHFIVGNKSIEKTLVTEMSAPLYAGMKLSQKMDGRLHLTETVAQNLLGGNQPSQVNVYYSRATNSVRGEWQVSFDGVHYCVAAESVSFIQGSKAVGTNQSSDKISLAMQKNF